MRSKTQSGFWQGVGNVLTLVPPSRPSKHSVRYHGRDLATSTASEMLQADWQAVLGDIVISVEKAELDESSARQGNLFESREAADDKCLASK